MSNTKRPEIFSSTASLEHLLERKGTECRSLNLPVNLISSDQSQQSGILLHSDSMTAKVGEIVELEFKLNFDGLLKRCCMLIEVAGVGEHGVTVGFHQFNEEVFRYIQKMLYDSVHSAEAPVLG